MVKSQRLRDGERWVDCEAARRLYEDAKDRIPALYRLLDNEGFGSGALSRLRGTDKRGREPASVTKMQLSSLTLFSKISGIPIERLLVEGTGLSLPADRIATTQNTSVAASAEPPPANLVRRPWVKVVRAEIASALVFAADDWGRVTVKLRLGNVGDAPASFVTTTPSIIPFEDEPSPLVAMEAARDQEPVPGQGFTLFPGEERDWSNGVVMDPAAVRRVMERQANQTVYVLFAGCISYRSPGSEAFHKTPFLYEVYQTVNGEWRDSNLL